MQFSVEFFEPIACDPVFGTASSAQSMWSDTTTPQTASTAHGPGATLTVEIPLSLIKKPKVNDTATLTLTGTRIKPAAGACITGVRAI